MVVIGKNAESKAVEIYLHAHGVESPCIIGCDVNIAVFVGLLLSSE